MDINVKKSYMLAIKRNNNDYLPLEWKYTKTYDKEDLSTLEGIDHFTSLSYADELLSDALDAKLINPFEKFERLAIIYKDNGKFRELKEGIVDYDEEFCLNFDFLCEFLEKNIHNKNMINSISNILGSFRDPSKELIQFVFILKNIGIFEKKGPNGVRAALSKFHDISYEEKRKASLIINRKFGPIYQREDEFLKTLDAS